MPSLLAQLDLDAVAPPSKISATRYTRNLDMLFHLPCSPPQPLLLPSRSAIRPDREARSGVVDFRPRGSIQYLWFDARDGLRSYASYTLMGGARLQMHRQPSIDGASDRTGCHFSVPVSSTATRKG